MDGVLAGAGAPETAPKAPNLTRSLSGDKPWRMYEESYKQVLYLLWRYLLWRMYEESYKQVLRDHRTRTYLLLLTMATFTMAVLTMAGAARPPDHLRAARAAEPVAGRVR